MSIRQQELVRRDREDLFVRPKCRAAWIYRIRSDLEDVRRIFGMNFFEKTCNLWFAFCSKIGISETIYMYLSTLLFDVKNVLLPMIAFIPVVNMPETSCRICRPGFGLIQGRQHFCREELVPDPPTV